MSNEAIEIGEKLHIITRRRFEGDLRRHFVGEVTGISEGLHRVRGHAFMFEPGTNEYRKLQGLRTRVLSLASEGFIVNLIPREVSLDSLSYRLLDRRVVITDGGEFTLEINEFGALR